MRFILAISIISISTVIFLTGFAPRKFCAGFQRGYTVGYQRWIGTDKSTTFPRCPSPDHKMSWGSRGRLFNRVYARDGGWRTKLGDASMTKGPFEQTFRRRFKKATMAALAPNPRQL